MKQKLDRYEMHKYWGKKPHAQLKELVEKYTKEGELLLELFSGYGVFSCEAYLNNRNVISNDLNPMSNFINNTLLMDGVDFNKLDREWSNIRDEFKKFNDEYFSIEINGEKVIAKSILRNRDSIPLMVKFNKNGKSIEKNISNYDAINFLNMESKLTILDWYPDLELIENSRISAKKGYSIKDLFTKRTLACHAKLFKLIDTYSSGKERALLELAFSANLANCSKLVPPIKSRGPMFQGAWMTGFYIGENYIENNVLSYYENRLNKVIKGKKDFLKNKKDSLSNIYKVTNFDAKRLDIDSNSIDYIFIDPPYGSAVPYFEQSILWNSWFKFNVDYENEIVISDSKKRNKNITEFYSDIYKVLSESYRVLKEEKYISITFHSISGDEWNAIIYACIRNGFILKEFIWLTQKAFTPRQMNRNKTIKGDVLITFQKKNVETDIIELKQEDFDNLLHKFIYEKLSKKSLSMNDIYLLSIEYILKHKYIAKKFRLLDILESHFNYSENLWSCKNE